MSKDEEKNLILYRLQMIDEKLASIKDELSAGHKRMDNHSDEILKLKMAKAFAGKQIAAVWCVCLLTIAAFLNSYFQAKYIKPKRPTTQVEKRNDIKD